MTKEVLEDTVFVSNMCALAKQVSAIDYERIIDLVNGSEDYKSLLCPYNENDKVTPALRQSLAILAFAAQQLKKVVVTDKELVDGVKDIAAKLPKELQEKLKEVTDILDRNWNIE